VRRAIKTLCEIGIISYVNRRKADGGLTSNLYTIHTEKLVKWAAEMPTMTEPLGTCDPRGMVTMTEKPLTRTFKLTKSSDQSYSQNHAPPEVRLISEDRKREICNEVGYDFNKLCCKDFSSNPKFFGMLPKINKNWVVE